MGSVLTLPAVADPGEALAARTRHYLGYWPFSSRWGSCEGASHQARGHLSGWRTLESATEESQS